MNDEALRAILQFAGYVPAWSNKRLLVLDGRSAVCSDNVTTVLRGGEKDAASHRPPSTVRITRASRDDLQSWI